MLEFDKSLKSLAVGVIMLAVAACQVASEEAPQAWNPLDDFEVLDPASIFATPEPRPQTSDYSTEQLSRGRYLVGLLGCGSCHTDGALLGAPDPDRLLAGSSTGIAYTNPLQDSNPGVVYPANLTPDLETGLGSWTMERLITMIRVGTTEHSASVCRSCPGLPMPASAGRMPCPSPPI